MDDIMVSILCTAYNHEKYIRKCLEGFVNQKTDFPFEVIVHDDASTDGTATIIREFEEKYPDIIHPIYQKENQYSKKISIVQTFLIPVIKGKYVARCEGDDFWIDSNKLQKQVSAMEAHPECHFCVHKVKLCSEDGSMLQDTLPHKQYSEGLIDSESFIKIIGRHWSFQTSSYFIRADEYCAYCFERPLFSRLSPVGDMGIMMFFGNLGPVMYLDDEMSCYRVNSVNSWTNKHNSSSIEKRAAFQREMVKVWEEYDKFTELKYHTVICDCIEYYRASAYRIESDYKSIVRECKNFLKETSFKQRMFIYAAAYVPGVSKLYNFIRRKNS